MYNDSEFSHIDNMEPPVPRFNDIEINQEDSQDIVAGYASREPEIMAERNRVYSFRGHPRRSADGFPLAVIPISLPYTRERNHILEPESAPTDAILAMLLDFIGKEISYAQHLRDRICYFENYVYREE